MKTRIIALAAAIGIGASALFISGASAATYTNSTSWTVPSAVFCPSVTSYYGVAPGFPWSGKVAMTLSLSGNTCTQTIYVYS